MCVCEEHTETQEEGLEDSCLCINFSTRNSSDLVKSPKESITFAGRSDSYVHLARVSRMSGWQMETLSP